VALTVAGADDVVESMRAKGLAETLSAAIMVVVVEFIEKIMIIKFLMQIMGY
jgi:hypothetical protein